MKTIALGAVFAGMWLVTSSDSGVTLGSPYGHEAEAAHIVSVAPATPAEPTGSPAVAPATLTEVVQQYCVVCHNDALMTGNVSLQAFSVENAAEQAETAERMIRKLHAGMMPPPGMPRPTSDTLLALVETLEATVEEAALAAPNLGERRFQRLSQAEYERVIHDVLALEVHHSGPGAIDRHANAFAGLNRRRARGRPDARPRRGRTLPADSPTSPADYQNRPAVVARAEARRGVPGVQEAHFLDAGHVHVQQHVELSVRRSVQHDPGIATSGVA